MASKPSYEKSLPEPGWMLRYAGGKDPRKLLAFLDKYAATMPRTLLRYSIENLDKKEK